MTPEERAREIAHLGVGYLCESPCCEREHSFNCDRLTALITEALTTARREGERSGIERAAAIATKFRSGIEAYIADGDTGGAHMPPDNELIADDIRALLDTPPVSGPTICVSCGKPATGKCEGFYVEACAAHQNHIDELAAEVTDVIAEIANERQRQVEQEGWSAEHDDEHTDGSLAQAAACYAAPHAVTPFRQGGMPLNDRWRLYWPWGRKWWKPKDRRRDLVRAAALIVAEIERLDRTSEPTETVNEAE